VASNARAFGELRLFLYRHMDVLVPAEPLGQGPSQATGGAGDGKSVIMRRQDIILEAVVLLGLDLTVRGGST
jgi:hypothetical protein